MKRIIALGPSGTYCDVALRNYLKKINEDLIIDYYPSIFRISDYMDDDTLAIIPFENTLDGFVIEGMDQIILNNYNIVSQIKLDIDFAFVSHAKNIDDVKNIYVSFKALGQCSRFISEHKFRTIKCDSNIEALNNLNRWDESYGAIIPMHSLNNLDFNINIPHVADSKSNETRFFIASTKPIKEELKDEVEASIVITAKHDRPGLLFSILKCFDDLNINLKSIMSRPMKTEMGKYRFYFECSLFKDDIELLNMLKEMFKNNQDFILQILGVYNKL